MNLLGVARAEGRRVSSVGGSASVAGGAAVALFLVAGPGLLPVGFGPAPVEVGTDVNVS